MRRGPPLLFEPVLALGFASVVTVLGVSIELHSHRSSRPRIFANFPVPPLSHVTPLNMPSIEPVGDASDAVVPSHSRIDFVAVVEQPDRVSPSRSNAVACSREKPRTQASFDPSTPRDSDLALVVVGTRWTSNIRTCVPGRSPTSITCCWTYWFRCSIVGFELMRKCLLGHATSVTTSAATNATAVNGNAFRNFLALMAHSRSSLMLQLSMFLRPHYFDSMLVPRAAADRLSREQQQCIARWMQRWIRKLSDDRVCRSSRSLRQPVVQPLGTLKLSVGPGAFALPRTASLDSGVLSGAAGDLIGAAVAIRRKVAGEVREDAVTVCVSKSAESLVRDRDRQSRETCKSSPPDPDAKVQRPLSLKVVPTTRP